MPTTVASWKRWRKRDSEQLLMLMLMLLLLAPPSKRAPPKAKPPSFRCYLRAEAGTIPMARAGTRNTNTNKVFPVRSRTSGETTTTTIAQAASVGAGRRSTEAAAASCTEETKTFPVASPPRPEVTGTSASASERRATRKIEIGVETGRSTIRIETGRSILPIETGIDRRPAEPPNRTIGGNEDTHESRPPGPRNETRIAATERIVLPTKNRWRILFGPRNRRLPRWPSNQVLRNR
mmetsp:Transcript_14421/g.33447  ORF Transcript_14421/g.33447 Transcript_14421/m.33447 type:complete len:236 (+) Transcript_14421:630-1337(+)